MNTLRLKITGRVGGTTQRTTNNGNSALDINVAVKRRSRDGEFTEWVNVSVYGKRAESLAPLIAKADFVSAEGDMRLSRFTNGQGQPVAKLEMDADDIDFVTPTTAEQRQQMAQRAPQQQQGGFAPQQQQQAPQQNGFAPPRQQPQRAPNQAPPQRPQQGGFAPPRQPQPQYPQQPMQGQPPPAQQQFAPPQGQFQPPQGQPQFAPPQGQPQFQQPAYVNPGEMGPTPGFEGQHAEERIPF